MTKDKMLFAPEEWKQIPPALRAQFWAETNYGKLPPSEELLAEIRAALEKK